MKLVFRCFGQTNNSICDGLVEVEMNEENYYCSTCSSGHQVYLALQNQIFKDNYEQFWKIVNFIFYRQEFDEQLYLERREYTLKKVGKFEL